MNGEPYFDRFDICEAYTALEWDYNVDGWMRERRSNQRRCESIGVQLHRMGFVPSMFFAGYASLSDNGKAIYHAAVTRLGKYKS